MAILDISEYANVQRPGQGQPVLKGFEPSLAYQQLAVGAGSVASAAFSSSTQVVRVHADVPCRITFGAAPVAAAGTSMRLAAGISEYFNVVPGQKLAVITST